MTLSGPSMLTDLLWEMGITPPHRAVDRPLVGVSACLLGRPVRYDGDHQYHAYIDEQLATVVTLREYCPEVGIGLPVPRPPIQVVHIGGEHRVRGVHQPDQDFTEALSGHADRVHEPLHGFILKARSPSCGLGTTPLYNHRNEEIGLTNGAFAARLRQRFPGLPLRNDNQLDNEDDMAAFVLAVYRHWQRPSLTTT